MGILKSEHRLFGVGVTTTCFIDGGTTADDSDVLMIWTSTVHRQINMSL